MLELTISQLIEESAEKYGGKAALSFPSENLTISFADLKRETDEVSKALLGNGFRKGSRIGIWSVNCSRWVCLALGAARIGVVFVPLNVSYRGRELADICSRANIERLFAMERFKGADCSEILNCFTKGDSSAPGEFSLRGKITSVGNSSFEGIGSWSDFMQAAEQISDEALDAARAEVTNRDTYILQYTSGTTSRPKGARLYQRGVLNTALDYAQLLHLSPEDSTCVPLPLFHCFGNVLTLLGGLISGSCTIYMEGFSASGMLPLLERTRATCVMGVPTMYTALMAQPGFDGSKLNIQKAGIGGAFCPAALADAIEKGFGMNQLIIGYGLSEAASLVTLSDICDARENRLYSVGKPLPGLEVSLYDPQSGKVSKDLECGEVVVRGFGVMLDYYEDEVETAKALDADGWLHTGDLGAFDAAGCMHIKGRLKDIIIRAGENISPSEIEELLLTLDGVHDAQCVGVHDKVMGEEIAAFIIRKPGAELTEDGVKQFIAAHMAKYKVPKYVLFTSAFPINGAGKVVKTALTKEAEELLALR